MALLHINKLSKRYAGAPADALHELTLSVNGGEVYGFLGANGAGKSTTIRLLLNFIQPTGGTATICDLDIVKDTTEVKRHVGYLSGDIALYNKVTAAEQLAFLQQLQPLKHKDYFASLVDRFEADLHKPVGELSKGNRQKIGIIQAFMHEPDVLVLDEPTSGLDPLMQEVFYQTVAEAKSRGAAVFTSSHNLTEVQRLCDRVGIIRSGSMIAEKPVTELSQDSSQQFELRFKKQVPAGLEKVAGVRIKASDASSATVQITGDIAPLLVFVAKHDIQHLRSVQHDLEDEFLRFYGDES